MKHPWVEGIQVCSNEGPRPFPRGGGDYSENVNHIENILKVFSRTNRPISTKLGTKHPLVERIQICSNDGPRPSTRGDKSEIVNFY